MGKSRKKKKKIIMCARAFANEMAGTRAIDADGSRKEISHR